MRKINLIEDPYLLITKDGLKFWVREEKGERSALLQVLGGEYETDFSKFDEVIDIGANIGSFSILVSSDVDKVFSYEPSSSTFEMFNKNIEENGISNVFAFNEAVSDRKGDVSFFINEGSPTSSTEIDGKGEEITVKSTTLEKIIEKVELNKCLLKIDCEGAEFPIINSTSPKILSKFAEILMEVHLKAGEEKEIFDKLEKAGFEIEKLRDGKTTQILRAYN